MTCLRARPINVSSRGGVTDRSHSSGQSARETKSPDLFPLLCDMEGGGSIFVYETLGLLSAAPEPDPASAGPPPSPPPPPSYSVLRSQITASVSEVPAVAPQDYLSLGGEVEGSTPGHSEPPTPSSPAREEEADPALETAWFRPNARFKSPMLQLHKEIVDFCDFMSPTQEEQASRASAVQSVISVVKYIWPECIVEVFGSYKTGLYLPTSDIDAVILESNVRSPQIGLQALKNALKQRGVAEKIQVIGRARVPIIKFVEKQSGVAFDISFDMTNGPKAADFIKDIVSKIPPLRPLCLILKVFLQQRELNEVYSGGIGSYALLTMLIAHLQIHWRGQDLKGRQSYMEQNLGILLVKFFELYGHKLNISDVGISCSSASSFFLKSARGFLNRERPSLLSIQDPQAPDNDIGKNSYNYFQIRSAFSTAYFWLTDAKRILALGPNRSILGTVIRPDPLLLKRKGGRNGDVTFDRLFPGAGEPVEQLTSNGDFLGIWDLSDEEPLPRENGVAGRLHINSSRKARKMKKKQRDTSGQSSDGKKRKREENGRGKVRKKRGKKKSGLE